MLQRRLRLTARLAELFLAFRRSELTLLRRRTRFRSPIQRSISENLTPPTVCVMRFSVVARSSLFMRVHPCPLFPSPPSFLSD
jgi:hypothetical protein